MDKLRFISNNSQEVAKEVEVYHIDNYPWQWNLGVLSAFVDKEGHYYMLFVPENSLNDDEVYFGYLLRKGQLKSKPQPIDIEEWWKTHFMDEKAKYPTVLTSKWDDMTADVFPPDDDIINDNF